MVVPSVPTVEDVCAWLNGSRPLDDVASELRKLRLAHNELGQVIELLRQHALLALGEQPSNAVGMRTSDFDEPF